MRISRDQMFMMMAEAAAMRSTCGRLNVGAVIVKDRSVVAIGYNGPPSGDNHCNPEDCEVKLGCKRAVHAEENALGRLPTWVLAHGRVCDLYVTDSPCEDCCGVIERVGVIRRIFFRNPYRINDHLTQMPQEVYRILPAGHLMNWRTRELVDAPYS